MKKINNIIFAAAIISLSLAGCSRAVIRHNLGIKADAPDEFMIPANKKPLVIPEDLTSTLPMPQSDAYKKLETYDTEETRKELFGEEITSLKSTEPSGVENNILDKAQADRVKANVRKTVENEYENRSSIMGTSPGGVMESIIDPFGYNRERPDVVNGKKENNRIRQALSKGKKVDPKKVIVEEID